LADIECFIGNFSYVSNFDKTL